MLTNITMWRRSAVEAARACPLFFKLKNVDGAPEAERENFRQGTIIHEAIAEYLQYCNGRDVEHDMSKLHSIAAQYIDMAWVKQCILSFIDVVPEGNIRGTQCFHETTFPFPIPGSDSLPSNLGSINISGRKVQLGTLYGTPDRVDKYDDHVLIRDWKSRRVSPHYDPSSPTFQAICYAWLVWNEWPDIDYVVFREHSLPWGDYVKDAEGNRCRREWLFETKPSTDLFLERIKAIVLLDSFEPRVSSYCAALCGYTARCPLISALGDDGPATNRNDVIRALELAVYHTTLARQQSLRANKAVSEIGPVVTSNVAGYRKRHARLYIKDTGLLLKIYGVSIASQDHIFDNAKAFRRRLSYSHSDIYKLLTDAAHEAELVYIEDRLSKMGCSLSDLIGVRVEKGNWTCKGLNTTQDHADKLLNEVTRSDAELIADLRRKVGLPETITQEG